MDSDQDEKAGQDATKDAIIGPDLDENGEPTGYHMEREEAELIYQPWPAPRGEHTADPESRDSWAWQAEPDPGPTGRQMEDWNIHNDHADGAEHDDREEDDSHVEWLSGYAEPDSEIGAEMYYALQPDGGEADRQRWADHWEAGE